MINIPNEVKELFKRDSVRKNIRVYFINGEHEDITAANMDTESFSLTESLCSRDEFRFGLYEASVVNFTTLNIGNIKGAIVEIQHEIDVSSLDEEPEGTEHPEDLDFPVYPIKYGTFKIDECTRQENNTRKIVAYTLDINVMNGFEKTKADIVYASSKYDVDAYKYILSALNMRDFPGELMSTSTYTGGGGVGDLSFETRYARYQYSQDELIKFQGQIITRLGWGRTTEEIVKTLADRCYEYCKSQGDTVTYDYLYKSIRMDILPAVYSGSFYALLQDEDVIYAKFPDALKSGDPHNLIIPISFTFRYKNRTVVSGKFRVDPLVYRFIPDYTTPQQLSFPNKKIGTGQYVIDTDYVKQNFSDIIETIASNAIYNRNNGFFIHNIETLNGLYPNEELYPNSGLYPKNNNENIGRELCYSVQYADEKTKPFGRVGLTYGANNYVYKDIVDDYEGNTEKYNLYSLTDNTIVQNLATSSLAKAKSIMDKVADNISKIRYTPATIRMKGLPYLQAGDLLEVSTATETFETIILRRTLRGIQSLEDIIEARGE